MLERHKEIHGMKYPKLFSIRNIFHYYVHASNVYFVIKGPQRWYVCLSHVSVLKKYEVAMFILNKDLYVTASGVVNYFQAPVSKQDYLCIIIMMVAFKASFYMWRN